MGVAMMSVIMLVVMVIIEIYTDKIDRADPNA